MKHIKNSKRDFYIFGKIGSGKDVITDFLKNYYSNLYPFKISGTIKQIITEQHGLSPISLENAKRTSVEIRNEHYKVSEYLGENHSLNRIKLLVNKNSFDQQNIINSENNYHKIIINDFRTRNELDVLFTELIRIGKQETKPILFILLRNFDKLQTSHYTEEHFNILEFIEKYNIMGELSDVLDVVFIHNQDDNEKDGQLFTDIMLKGYKNITIEGDKNYKGKVEALHIVHKLSEIIKDL